MGAEACAGRDHLKQRKSISQTTPTVIRIRITATPPTVSPEFTESQRDEAHEPRRRG